MQRSFWVLLLVGSFTVAAVAQGDMKMGKNSATEDKIVQMEKDLWEAWKTHNADPFKNNMSDKSVDVGAEGVMGKEDAVKMIAGSDCQVTSYSISDTKVTWLDKNTALLTYKGTQDATCGGHKVPDAVWASSIWTKEGSQWKAAFHQETPAMATNAGGSN